MSASNAASIFVSLALLACPAASRAEPPQPLPALGADIHGTSVSGLSSGAYMAGQFEIAHARIVVGAAIIAGGPYACAEIGGWRTPFDATLNASRAVNGCMHAYLLSWGVPNAHGSAERVRQLAKEGKIDAPEDVRGDRVYLFTGQNDHVVEKAVVEAAAAFYRDIGLRADQIALVENIPAGHAFVTESRGAPCERTEAPFVDRCGYNQAGKLLAHIHGPLAPPSSALQGKYVVFDQQPYWSDLGATSLGGEGIVYIPDACVTTPGCRVHIAFHGCGQNRSMVGDAFVKNAGFARWADTNRLIVLFPQVASGSGNPDGCWDWWGYTGGDFLTRDAPQIKAVYRMLERLATTPH